MKIKAKTYIDNQISWVRRMQKEKDVRIEMEGRLRESENKGSQRATDVFNDQLEKWKEGSNEWRTQSNDEKKLMPQRGEVQTAIGAVQQSVNELNKRMDDKLDGVSKEITSLREYRSGAMGREMGSSAFWDDFKEGFRMMATDIRSLRESRSNTEGRGMGMHNFWGYFVGAIGTLCLIASVIIAILSIRK